MELGRLKLDPGTWEDFDFLLPPPESDGDCVLLSGIQVSGSLVYGGNGYHVVIRLLAEAQLPCSRCLIPVHQELAFDFQEEFDEQEYPGEDAVMDLADIAEQLWVTSIPMRALCHDECKGLCPQCGKNRNDEECDCPMSSADPRLEILRALLDEGDGSH